MNFSKKKMMSREEFWEMVEILDWGNESKNKDEDTILKLRAKLDVLYPHIDVDEMSNICRHEVREELKEKSGFHFGNDSGWDLSAHIVGSGKKFYDKTLEDIENGVYKDDWDILQCIWYRENFEYIFSDLRTEDEMYGTWCKYYNRPERINEILN